MNPSHIMLLQRRSISVSLWPVLLFPNLVLIFQHKQAKTVVDNDLTLSVAFVLILLRLDYLLSSSLLDVCDYL